jgi:Domain of unknown function (DUF4157)/HNH/ENDO VII superfamily nuclease with conserved GHE residues
MRLAAVAKPESEKTRTAVSENAAANSAAPAHSCGASAGLPRFLRNGCGCAHCSKVIQTKLATDTPGDFWEQEAERIADAAMRPGAMQDPAGGISLLKSGPRAAIPTAGSGFPLSPEIRRKVEPAVHSDLSHVRVHDSAPDHDVASSLGAKAFTHGSDIWLGPNQSSNDVRLMAHEATHVVQQGAGQTTPPAIQRAPRESAQKSQRSSSIAPPAGSTDPALAAMMSDLPPRSATQPPRREDAPDPAEYRKKQGELQGQGHSAAATANKGQAQLKRAASGAKAEAGKPAKPGKTGQDRKAKSAAKGKGGSQARKLPMVHPYRAPVKPATVKVPEIAPAVDSAGKPLRADLAGDAQILRLTAVAQAMRVKGFILQERAAQERHNASILQANMHIVHEGTTHASEGIAHSEDHLAYRREVVGQASGALTLSEQKAEMVASKAPEYSATGSEGKEKSGPMAGEAKDLVSKNASETPDDEDAAEKSNEQGGKINSVSSDIGSMDDAITQTKAKADNLSQEAAQAKETNTKTQQNIAGTHASLDQTQTRLTQLTGANTAAKTKLAGLARGPQQVLAGAAALDKQGAAAINSSKLMEDRIHASQKNHAQALHSVPASKIGKKGAGRPPALIQRQAVPGAPDPNARINLNLAGAVGEALPSWLTGEEKETEQARAAAQLAEQTRRDNEIKEINAQANGDFSRLTAADKVGIALSLTTRHLFGSVAGIKWPDMLGKLAQGLVDPRIALMGVVSGLSMTLSGAANLLSIEQWKKDPLGNLLKSAADIATGIAIILGSITALAVAIIAILVLAAIFSFGALGPVAAAVIPFCSTVVATVGPWTLEAAAIALDLNLLVMIKDLVSAATAKTASDLQVQSDHITEDAKTAGNMAMQIGMAAVGEAGGKALMSTEFGQGLAAGAHDVGEAYGIVKPGAAPVAPAEPVAAPSAAEPVTAPSGAEPVTAPRADAVPASTPAEARAPADTPATAKADAAAAIHEGPAPKVEAAAPAETGEARQPEAQEPPRESAVEPAKAPEGAETAEAAKPPVEENIAAQEPGAGGHTVKVTKTGECVVCSPTCPSLSNAVEDELAGSNASAEQKAAIEQKAAQVEQMTDPVAKAKAGAEVQTEANELAEPPGGGGPSRAAAEARLEELSDLMKGSDISPEDLGYSKSQWEEFLEETETNPERAVRDLEGRLKRAADRGVQTSTTPEAQRGDFAKQADQIRDEMNARTSRQTTGPERAQAAAEAAERQPEPERGPAADEESGSDSPYDEAARARELYEEQLRRPSLRTETKQAVWEAAESENKMPDGRYRDPDGVVRNPPYQIGHRYGLESRRLILQAMEERMTQAEFNDFINSHPEFFRIESAEFNLSHQGEMPGND